MRKSAQTVIRPDAYYTIAAANGRVLEVADFNTENGASVRLWSYEGQPGSSGSLWKRGTASTASGTALRARSWTWPCPASATAPGSTSGPRPRARVSAGRSWRQAAARSSCATSWPIRSLTGGNARGERHPGPDLAGCLWREPALEARPCARAPAEQGDPRPDAEGRAQEGRRQADPDADREENLRQGRKKNQ